jgi:lysozyme
VKINQAGLDIVKEREGLRLAAYRDTGGIWTIGYGHTSMAGSPTVTPTLRITAQDAEDILRKDISTAEVQVARVLTRTANENQFSAMVSFCFNVGPTAFAKSTLLRKFNAGDIEGAANEFLRWVHDDGVKLEGLVKRRAMERALFLKPLTTPVVPVPSVPVEKAPALIDLIIAFIRKLFG